MPTLDYMGAEVSVLGIPAVCGFQLEGEFVK
jgi:hypothetical protein